MTAEEVWRKAKREYNKPVCRHLSVRNQDAAAVIRTAMEAYAAEKVAEERAAEPTEAMEYRVGDKVVKPRGYPFPGTVVAAFIVAGGQRYVVESELAPGMLHIFSPSQLALAANQHHGGNDADT